MLVFALFLTLAAPQAAPTTPASPAPQAEPRPEERVVCRRERVVGSNRSQRVCTTVTERQLREDAAQRLLERHTSTPQTCEDPVKC